MQLTQNTLPKLLLLSFIVAALLSAGPVSQEHSRAMIPTLCLRKLVIPEYPTLARLSEKTGTVLAKISLDGECHVVAGPEVSGASPELRDSVIRTINKGQGFEVNSCKPGTNTVTLRVTFALEGQPTNQWSPTLVRFREPYTLTINTRPPDLAALGLQRIARGSKRK